MSRFLVLGLGLLFFVTGLLALSRFGDHFSAYAFPRDSLSVEKPLERS